MFWVALTAIIAMTSIAIVSIRVMIRINKR